MAHPAETPPNSELDPDPTIFSGDEIIEGLKAVELKWKDVPNLVAIFSPWVKYPEQAYEILEAMKDELKKRFDIDLFAEIRAAIASTHERTE